MEFEVWSCSRLVAKESRAFSVRSAAAALLVPPFHMFGRLLTQP